MSPLKVDHFWLRNRCLLMPMRLLSAVERAAVLAAGWADGMRNVGAIMEAGETRREGRCRVWRGMRKPVGARLKDEG